MSDDNKHSIFDQGERETLAWAIVEFTMMALALWKILDIFLWIRRHLSISWN